MSKKEKSKMKLTFDQPHLAIDCEKSSVRFNKKSGSSVRWAVHTDSDPKKVL